MAVDPQGGGGSWHTDIMTIITTLLVLDMQIAMVSMSTWPDLLNRRVIRIDTYSRGCQNTLINTAITYIAYIKTSG